MNLNPGTRVDDYLGTSPDAMRRRGLFGDQPATEERLLAAMHGTRGAALILANARTAELVAELLEIEIDPAQDGARERTDEERDDDENDFVTDRA